MAQTNTPNVIISNPTPLGELHPDGFIIRDYVSGVAADGTGKFVKGDLVVLSSGKVVICASDPASVLGIAMADSPTDDTLASVPVAVFQSGALVAFNLYTALTTSSTGPIIPTAAHVGVAMSVGIDAVTGKWVIDTTAEATNKLFTVIDVIETTSTTFPVAKRSRATDLLDSTKGAYGGRVIARLKALTV